MKKFRYVYEYTSPFGENWRVDKLYLGFIWLTYDRPYHISVYDYDEINKYVDKLNTNSLKLIRKKKLEKLNLS